MTINYNLAVSTSKPWTLFKLLLKWRGSIWKAVMLELVVWLMFYGILSIIYRTALSYEQQKTFERVVMYCEARLTYIPLNFMLGFFVTAVVNRWTYLYQIIGFIDNIGLMTAEYVRGRTEQARMYRRNIVRYCELAQVLVFRDVSMRTRRRFPTLDTVVAAGFMMPHEKERFDEIQYRYSKYWLPFQWAFALTYDARKLGLIESDYYQVVIQEEIKKFRTGLAWICNYDWVPIPIMYPQLVCLAVHTYFIVCLLARQYIVSEDSNKRSEIDLYFPIMSTLQFIFYMGWMKVAEAMLNPFGEDDDDFECNALIDRNITMVLMMVDQGYDRPPALKRDPFWDEEVEPLYSEESAKIPTHPLKGSVSEIRLPDHVQEIRMVPHCDDRYPLINSPNLRRRVSVVPVTQQEQRQPRPSLGSLEMFRSFKNKVERSLSRGQLFDEEQPRKTVSHGHLPVLDVTKVEDEAQNGQKSFVNSAFETNDETDKKDNDGKEVKKSASTTNLKSPHDFPHHVLDDVLEENEEEVKALRKKSVIEPGGFVTTGTSSNAGEDSTSTPLSPPTDANTGENKSSSPLSPPNDAKAEEAKSDTPISPQTDEAETTSKRKTSEFIIGHDS